MDASADCDVEWNTAAEWWPGEGEALGEGGSPTCAGVVGRGS